MCSVLGVNLLSCMNIKQYVQQHVHLFQVIHAEEKWCDVLNSLNWLEEQLCSALALIVLRVLDESMCVYVCVQSYGVVVI